MCEYTLQIDLSQRKQGTRANDLVSSASPIWALPDLAALHLKITFLCQLWSEVKSLHCTKASFSNFYCFERIAEVREQLG